MLTVNISNRRAGTSSRVSRYDRFALRYVPSFPPQNALQQGK